MAFLKRRITGGLHGKKSRAQVSASEDSTEDENCSAPSVSGSDDCTPAAANPSSHSFFSGRKSKLPSKTSGRDTPLGSRKSSFINLGKKRNLGLFKRKERHLKERASIKAAPASGESRVRKQVMFQQDSSDGSARLSRGGSRNLEASLTEHAGLDSSDLHFDISELDEEGLRRLREQLSNGDKESSEKAKRLLHRQYPAFIAASKEIQAMDAEMQSLRALLNGENTVLTSIKKRTESKGRLGGGQEHMDSLRSWSRSWNDSPEGLRWNDALQKVDIAIAEKRPAEALPLLKQAEKALMPGQKSGLYSHSLQGGVDVKTEKQALELAKRRQKLGELVTSQVSDFTVGSTQMQVATQVLASLSGRAHALKKHLEAHTFHLRKNVNQLLKPQNAGGDADGTEFSNALSQLVFGAIAAAAEDVNLIFGKDLKDLASIFLVWALTETEKCALDLKWNAISPFAAPVGLGPTVSCCLLAHIHCSALQSSHNLRLTPRLMRDLWPACEQVLQRRVKRIVEDLKAAVMAEVEALVQKRDLALPPNGGWSDLMQIFPSADLVLDELEAIVRILVPLASPRVREAVSHAFLRIYREYTNAITAQFSRYRDDEAALPPILDEAIEPALEVAHSMVEQFLPELAEPLRSRCGTICRLKPLYDQLNAFQDNLLPPDEEESDYDAGQDESPRKDNGESSATTRSLSGTPLGSLERRQNADWRKYQQQSQLTADDSEELGEEEFVPGDKNDVGNRPKVLTKSISRLGQIMSEEEGLQAIQPVKGPAADRDFSRLKQIVSWAKQDAKQADSADAVDDIEEMSEELSDYDENEMIAQLTERR